MRTEEQNALFKQGLGCLGTLYSHPHTRVLRLTSFPDGHKAEDQAEGTNVAKYFDRGWCFTEQSWAGLTKAGHLSLDLGKMRAGVEYDWDSLTDDCTQDGGRRPPLLPSAFAAELETKSFTNGKDDMPIVKKVQRSAFTHEFEKVHVLNFCRLDWGDDEATAIADIVTQYASAAGNLTDLRLHFNHVGDAGAAALAECLVTVPSLKELRLNGNKIGGAGAAALADALGRRKCAIESLGLGGNPLGDDGVIAICDAVVASAATLKVFIVDKCGLTDAAVPALCAALATIGPTVAMMNLVNDGFTDAGRAQLQAAEPRLGTKNFTLVKEAKGH